MNENFNRAAALATLIETMTRLTAPPPLTLPTGPADMAKTDVVALANDAAVSASKIADACARLGDNNGANDQQLANTLWNETLKQIERVQRNLDYSYRYPFQSKTLPESSAERS